MNFYFKRKRTIGIIMSLIAVMNIFLTVINGRIINRFMVGGILMLAVGMMTLYSAAGNTSSDTDGKEEGEPDTTPGLMKKKHKKFLDEILIDKDKLPYIRIIYLDSMILYILQLTSLTIVASGIILNEIIEEYEATFTAVIISFGAFSIISEMLSLIFLKIKRGKN